MFCVIYIIETFPLEFFDLISNFDFRSGLTANIEIKESNIMLGLYGGEDLDVIFNTVVFISKWKIWKIRNKVKYNQEMAFSL
jgi:hypothetical protein